MRSVLNGTPQFYSLFSGDICYRIASDIAGNCLRFTTGTEYTALLLMPFLMCAKVKK